MRRTMDRPPLTAIEDVAIAAHPGVTRPLVTGHGEEAMRHFIGSGQTIELVPERISDLEVVALVANYVEEGLVTGKGEMRVSGVGADRLFALAVQVAPVAAYTRFCQHTERIAATQLSLL